MDSILKFAEGQLQERMGGSGQQQQQQQNYGNQGESYGNQGGYQGQNQGYGGQNQGGYGGNQGGYGGEQGEQNYGQTGGAQFNRPHGSGGANQGGGLPQIDQEAAINAANAHASNGNENAGLFSQAFGKINTLNHNDADIDEEAVQQNHAQAYQQGNAGNMDASSMGTAAALQAMKMFTSGGGSPAGGNQQSNLIGMAMSEAAKLFDQSGGAASGDKGDAVSAAGQMIMKMMIKSQISGGGSGGLSTLMGLAGTFM